MTEPHLNGKHDTTLRMLFQHPLSHNLEWKDVIHLLSTLGTVDEKHDGRLAVSVNGHETVLHRPKHKDLGTDELMQVRHLLTQAGITAPV
jgi:hypothetical protein